MQQTVTSTSTTATPKSTTKVTSNAEHTIALPISVATSSSNKVEQFNSTPTTTAAQVITVVAPSHTTQTHGQPVVVQVSSGGQLIAVAVSPENAGQASSTQSGLYPPKYLF